jgi:large subunit ribosomal protein L10
MRAEKASIVNEVKEQVEKSDFVFLADYHGLNVTKMAELRTLLSEKKAGMQVVKNSYVQLALPEDVAGNLQNALQGPTVVVFGAGDVSEVAKVIKKFVTKHALPIVKGGCLDNKALTAEDIKAMADLPSREVLYSQVVGTIAAPMTQLVGVMGAKVLSLLYVLKAIEEKKSAA